jgi:hypothetical protein
MITPTRMRRYGTVEVMSIPSDGEEPGLGTDRGLGNTRASMRVARVLPLSDLEAQLVDGRQVVRIDTSRRELAHLPHAIPSQPEAVRDGHAIATETYRLFEDNNQLRKRQRAALLLQNCGVDRLARELKRIGYSVSRGGAPRASAL